MSPSSRFIDAAGVAKTPVPVTHRGRRPSRRTSIVVEILVHSPLWNTQRSAKAMLRRAIIEAACAVCDTEGELAVVLTDDSAMRTLNRDWRSKDHATNVLSFPVSDNHPGRRRTTGRRGNGRRTRQPGARAVFSAIS